MLLLALDASTTHIGWAYLDGDRLLRSGEITLRGDPAERLRVAAWWLIGRDRADVVALEEPFVGRNGHTAMQLARMTGALAGAITVAWKVPVVWVGPTEAKLAATGDGRADKRAVRKMIQAQFPNAYPGEHACDAVGVALAAAGKIKLEELTK